MNNKTKEKLLTTYREMPSEMHYPIPSEKELKQFEAEFGKIPPDVKWIIENTGTGDVTPIYTFPFDQLLDTHLAYRKDAATPLTEKFDVFIFGADGSGNDFGIEKGTGRNRDRQFKCFQITCQKIRSD